MLQIGISNLVGQIVRHEMLGPTKQSSLRQHAALHINFDLRMSSFTDSKSYDQSRGLHLLYHVNPGGSYISVFSGVTDSPFGKITEVKTWVHECTHDTCWRESNIFSRVYFDMAEKINEARVKDGLAAIAPKDMSEFNSFRGDTLFAWVAAEVTKDPEDDHNYRRLIRLL